MAPPRRHTKKGDRRMDAALDAMRQYGFNQKVVRRTIKELLRVYDGEWTFMEEYAYKLLIDTIIDNQEAEAQTQSESSNRELVASDLQYSLDSIPLIGPSEPNNGASSSQAGLEESHRYPRRNRRSKYAVRTRNILGAKRSRNYNMDLPCKQRFCYGYFGEGEQEDLIDVEPQSAASAGVPVALLLSHSNHKESNDPRSIQFQKATNSHPT